MPLGAGSMARIRVCFRAVPRWDFDFLTGTKWVITGSFQYFKPREKAGELIKEYGGEIIGGVSSKTNYLLCGESPGSKYEKAIELGIKIIYESEFLKIIQNKSL